MAFKTLRDEVRSVLTDHPAARDSDNLLVYWWMAHFWRKPETVTATDMLRAMERGEIPGLETFTRARRWVQENYEELRGKHYEARQRHSINVQSELGYDVLKRAAYNNPKQISLHFG